MTPAEISARLVSLRARMGVKSDVSILLSGEGRHREDGKVRAVLYPMGLVGNGPRLEVDAFDSFAEVLDAMDARWAEYEAHHDVEMIRSMALEIIRLTAEHGSCSEYGLRTAKFSKADVNRYGERATAEANRMADCGPFSIIAAIASNEAA